MKKKSLKFNRETIQKLDANKLASVYAGNAEQDAEAASTILLSATATTLVLVTGPVTATVIGACTIADAAN